MIFLTSSAKLLKRQAQTYISKRNVCRKLDYPEVWIAAFTAKAEQRQKKKGFLINEAQSRVFICSIE